MRHLMPVAFVVPVLSLGCASGTNISQPELAEAIQRVSDIPVIRFMPKAQPGENLILPLKGEFSAGVERKGDQFWLWTRTMAEPGKPIRDEIFHIQGEKLLEATADVKLFHRLEGPPGLKSESSGEVFDTWYSITFGRHLPDLSARTVHPEGMRFPTSLKDASWVPGPAMLEAKIQQVVMTNLLPRLLFPHPSVKRYELTLYCAGKDIYLLESWRDAQGDWYLGYHFDRSPSRIAKFIPDTALRFDGIHLRKTWWKRLEPWMSVVKWNNTAH